MQRAGTGRHWAACRRCETAGRWPREAKSWCSADTSVADHYTACRLAGSPDLGREPYALAVATNGANPATGRRGAVSVPSTKWCPSRGGRGQPGAIPRPEELRLRIGTAEPAIPPPPTFCMVLPLRFRIGVEGTLEAKTAPEGRLEGFGFPEKIWSGRRDSNPRPQPWQNRTPESIRGPCFTQPSEMRAPNTFGRQRR